MEPVSEVAGVVRAVDGDSVWVEVAQEGCGRCAEPGGCGGNKLTQVFCAGPRAYQVKSELHPAVGAQVRIGIPVAALTRSATLAYVLPLCGVVGGAGLGMTLAGDPGAMAGGLLGLVASFILLRIRSRRLLGISAPVLLP